MLLMLDIKQWSVEWGGRTLSVETGRFALQSTRSVTVRYADTVIMATVVRSEKTREGLDFFPLMVDFEEKLYAAGKIKGSRFIKREGRPSDESILMGRLVDRAIRPLFDVSIRNDVQVVVTPLSIDNENDAATTGLVAACIALSLSPIPWDGPIAGARVGMNPDGSFVLNPTTSFLKENGMLDVVVAGTPDRLVMVEAGAQEVPEDTLLGAMRFGLEQTAQVLDLIARMQKDLSVVKSALPAPEDTPVLHAKKALRDSIFSLQDTHIFNTPKVGKDERNTMIASVKDAARAALAEKGFEAEAIDAALTDTKSIISDVISARVLERGQRLDGRGLEDIRELQVAVDLLPRVHGSAMFMRGDTQVLSVVTLGAPGDVQTLDTMEEEGKKRYMHHYNDTPFAYGETGPIRGPGRRAIGHGALAERALEPVLPQEADFPYAIRVVSEVMGSNGSSSMASTCGSTLSLMAAGVPIRKPVAGIAMGLSSRMSEGKWKVLTDLQDVEDGDGGMDFKIAGTADGVTAVQMDTKTHGLTWDIVAETVRRAFDARMRILNTMASVIAAPRADLSSYAPRIETIRIDPEKIRDVIGPGGKVINKIIEDTGVQIDIEQDGRVMITSSDAAGLRKAVDIVNAIVKEVQAGEIYDGTVVRIEDFGAFVQLTPNKDGLVHVSEFRYERVGHPSDVVKMGDTVKVLVKEIDGMGRVNLSMKALLPKPEGYVERPPMDRSPRTGGDRHGGGGRRFGGSRPPRRDA
jgi:polyribonucleotide nucleotidyltransferase